MNSNLEFRDGSTQRWVRLADLSLGGTRNGLYKPKEFHGSGAKIVNMGELFAFPRLANEEMKRIGVTQDELDRFGLQAGDLLFARRSLVADGAGKCSIVVHCDAPTVFESSIIRLRPAWERVEPEYLFYLFRSSVGDQLLDRIRKRDAVSGITGKDLAALEVPLPAKEVQRNVCDLLSTLDNRIDHNRTLATNLEAIARRLFKSWFVDFNPVRAKAAGEKPSGLADDIAVLFPDRFVESELGEIPEGWRVGCVDDEFSLTMGQSPPGSTYNEIGDGLPFYQGRTDFTFRFPKRRVFCSAPSRFAKPGDTLVSVRAPVGDINMALEDCAIGRGVAAARHRSGSRSYTYHHMYSLEDVFANFEADGTVFGSISKKDFHAISCIVPSDKIIEAFEQVCNPIDGRLEICEQESRTLATLRDALLPKLISGEIRVSDAHKQIEEALG